MKKLFFSLAISFFSTSLLAQWTTSGNNIYNTNTGTVVIQRQTGSSTSQMLVVDPQGAGSITLGVANTGVGGYTSLTFSISALQNGYSSLQSIKSAGSAYGVLSLNPSGGGVGIGTTDPGPYKLAVEGPIGARSIKVTLANPWADYVFDKNYKLRSLYALESYIKLNNHLPGIPSATEVQKEGLDLAQMNAKLLEKIEELTLYVIELKKENEKIKNDIKRLNNKRKKSSSTK